MRRVWLAILLLCSVQAYATGLRPQDRLAGVGAALRQLEYKGVFTYEQAGQRDTLQWVHAIRDGVERERLLALDGEHREVLRDRPVGCMRVAEQAMHSRLLEWAADSAKSLDSHYTIAAAGESAIAGRAAEIIRVTPRDEYRFGYRFYVDTETGFLLGADMLGNAEAVLESFRFVSIEFSTVTDADLKPVTADPMRMEVSHCDASVGKENPAPPQAAWQFDLPAGFMLCSVEKREGPEDALIYSDGLNHFTVFVRSLGNDAAQPGVNEYRGNLLLHGQDVDLPGGRYRVTVVGEIPGPTATRILHSIAPVVTSIH